MASGSAKPSKPKARNSRRSNQRKSPDSGRRSSDALDAYTAKRDFERTPEPAGTASHKGDGNSFVVQKHAASRLHYDFRLELDGVLKSWAIAKGPSLDPAHRRLAVHVEDHPLEYGSFEGVIPQGQYGGGTVMLWDRGTWEPVGERGADYEGGHMKVRLRGEKLRGVWALVRMGGKARDERRDNWLLIKDRDEEALRGEPEAWLEENAWSVASGRAMEEIAEAKDAVWNSEETGPERRKG